MAIGEWEDLQSVLMLLHNKIVREEFQDIIEDSEGQWRSQTPRGRLKYNCLLRDRESAIVTILRFWLYYGLLGGMKIFQPGIYGIPIDDYQIQRTFKPQIQLYFQEPIQEVAEGYAPITAEISFRLMEPQYQGENLSQVELKTLANRIKAEFGGRIPFKWRKGKLMATYTDKEKGYQLQLLVFSEAEAKDVIRSVLAIKGDVMETKFLNFNRPENASAKYPTVPDRKVILGKTRRMPRKRPVANVVFQYAVCHIHGLPNPIVLYDRTGTFNKPLVN